MNNEPAFPRVPGQEGMSLRDYFAAKALQAIIGNQNALDELHKVVASEDSDNAIASRAYYFADAMLKARSESHR